VKLKRSHSQDRLAKVYDAEILPLWSERFGRLLLRDLPLPPKAMVLDVGTSTGFTAMEVLRRMDDAGRIISIEPSPALLDVARAKAGTLGGKRIFFRTESPEPKLSFTDEVFDAVVCNLMLAEVDDPERMVADFARVAKAGGRVAVTVPLAGTFDEFHDLLRETLTQLDRGDSLARFDEHLASVPTAGALRGWLEAAGLHDVRVETDEYRLLFRSSREFFFAPLIEYGPLALWKEIAGGRGEAMQAVFLKVKEAIDAYFAQSPFAVTVRAGCATGRRPTDEERAYTAPAQGSDGPTAEVQLDTSDFVLVESTHASFVGERPPRSDGGEDDHDDDEPVVEPGNELLPPGANTLRLRRL
jgi:ubiquinone/menaquinone biosynthesis C-methylase UbiE